MTVKQCLMNAAYNLDRAVASLFGAKPQDTISSEAGRTEAKRWWMRTLAWGLNKLERNHTTSAQTHATALDAVDDGKER